MNENDRTDDRLRQLAEALVADRPSPPAIDAGPGAPYLDRRATERRPRSRVLVSVAAATLLVAGGIALAQGRSAVAPDAVDAASAPLVAVTTVPGVTSIDPASLLDRSYEIRRGSVDDPTQNRITPVVLADVPSGLITADDAIAAAPADRCPSMADPPACDPPYAVARLARYQGFGGYTSAEDIDGPGGGDLHHDTIVWVVVRHADDFERDPGNHYLITALLIDAASGELVSGGELLGPA